MPSRAERIVWAAGFIDADGSININKARSNHPTANNWVAQLMGYNRDLGAMEELRSLFGGHATLSRGRSEGNEKRKAWANVYTWRCRRDGIEAALTEMIPYLLVKRRHAETLLEYIRGPGRKGVPFLPLPPEQVAGRQRLYDQMKYLNYGAYLNGEEPPASAPLLQTRMAL